MKRLFIAIKIPAEKNLMSVYNYLTSAFHGKNIRWVLPQNYHITLIFLGDVQEYYLPSLSMSLKNTCSKYAAFQMYFNAIGTFGPKKSPSVLWIDFKMNETVLSMQKEIVASMQTFGFNQDEKLFKPHLTLGRIKKSVGHEILQFEFPSRLILNKVSEIKEIYLMESILKKEGPEYSVVNSFFLTGDCNSNG